MITRLIAKSQLSVKSFGRFSTAIIDKSSTPSSVYSGKFQYVDNQLVPVNHLVLSTRVNMEEYVMKVVKDYFRTSNRAELTLNSKLADHSLDSMDTIELVMQVENDLGYMIPTENLAAFSKPVHLVNYIEQVENFKHTYKKQPLS